MQLQPETWKTWSYPEEFPLTLGGSLPGFTLAYETWGQLNERRDNAVAVLHALSGSSHVRSSAEHPAPGWWEKFLDGSGPLRPDRHFIVCANLLGGCYGSTGPLSVDPRSGRRYMTTFPPLAIDDMVNSFRLLLRSLGVERGLTVIGGSMGGMLALDWAARFPGEVRQAIVLASPGKSYAQTIALRAVQREAILSDPDWQDGWYDERRRPVRGLALARKIGIITYRSDREFRERFGREVFDPRPHFREGKFQVQSYLDHQGEKFVQRFDPNTYLYYSRAMDLFDLGQGFGSLEEGLRRIRARCLLIAFDTDILCPLYQVEEVRRALEAAGAPARLEVISTPHGHDAFLIELAALNRAIDAFLE